MAEIGPPGGPTQEEVEDIAGSMAASGHGLAYDDSQGVIKKTRTGPTPYDAANTFAESGLTLSTTQLSNVDGRLWLSGNISAGSTATRKSDNNTYDDTGKRGAVFEPNSYLAGIRTTVSSNTSSITTAYLLDDSSTLDSVSASSGSTVELTAEMVPGKTYYVVADAGGSTYTSGFNNRVALPAESTDVDITSGCYNSRDTTTTSVYNFVDVTGLTSDSTSGSATLEWNHPTDIYEWNVATFTRTPDRETVDVFVAYDDGSGWTRTNGGNPISRNYSLADDANISPSDSVRIEAEISRTNTANDPTLDSAMRSWVL